MRRIKFLLVAVLLLNLFNPLQQQAVGAQLITEDEKPAGYDRKLFKHWIDANKNGCDTRAEVLILEATVVPKLGAKCKISGGKWLSAYDGKTTTKTSDLDVDHLVPLAEAWRSGAWAWTPQQRESYANDLSDSRALIAVSLSQNRSKGDKDVSKWLPSKGVCTYVTSWLAIKYRYSLSVDNTEARTLNYYSSFCKITSINVEILEEFKVYRTPTPASTPTQTATPTPTPTPTQTATPTVSPGAFCSPAGATGKSAAGVTYTCKTSPSDSRNRWRQ